MGLSSSSWLTNVDGIQDLWCFSTVCLLSTQDEHGKGSVVLQCSWAAQI